MQCYWPAAAVLALTSVAPPASACIIAIPVNLDDIKYADVVVVGRIVKYRIILDMEARKKRQEYLDNSPDLPASRRKSLESQTGFLSDHARFDVIVDEVLVGEVPKTISVTWDNSTFSEPEAIPSGQFLIALRDPSSKMPPLRGPSATLSPNRELNRLTVLQAPCSGAFIFGKTSDQAEVIRQMLTSKSTIRD